MLLRHYLQGPPKKDISSNFLPESLHREFIEGAYSQVPSDINLCEA